LPERHVRGPNARRFEKKLAHVTCDMRDSLNTHMRRHSKKLGGPVQMTFL
jgi:hypothetical protein